MELCDDGHDEICFDSRNCPVCEIHDELQRQISDLEDEIYDLKEEQKNGQEKN